MSDVGKILVRVAISGMVVWFARDSVDGAPVFRQHIVEGDEWASISADMGAQSIEAPRPDARRHGASSLRDIARRLLGLAPNSSESRDLDSTGSEPEVEDEISPVPTFFAQGRGRGRPSIAPPSDEAGTTADRSEVRVAAHILSSSPRRGPPCGSLA